MPCRITVRTGGQRIVVGAPTSGGVVSPTYTTASLGVALALPVTTSSDLDIWLPSDGGVYQLPLSHPDGTVLAPASVTVTAASAAEVSPAPTAAQVAVDVSTLPGTYVTYTALAEALPDLTGVDAYSLGAAAAAYSTRRVVSGYSGPCMTVRRVTDAATIDVPFTSAGDMDTAALLSFIGAGDGRVVTWYDQSGNSRHVTQGNATYQPPIVAAGALYTDLGTAARPAVAFDGAVHVLLHQGTCGVDPSVGCTATMVVKGTTGRPWGVRQNSGTADSWFVSSSAGTLAYAYTMTAGVVRSSLQSLGTTLYDGASRVFTLVTEPTLHSSWSKGTLGTVVPTSTIAGTFAGNNIAIGATVTTSPFNFFAGRIAEVILLPRALNPIKRAAADRGAGQYYGIDVT